MKKNLHVLSLKHLLQAVLLLVIGYSPVSYCQETSVTFQVNMNHQIALGNFNPDTQSVDVAGTFNNWGSPATILSDADNDGIYTAVATMQIGTTIQFKTRIDQQWNGTEEFAGGGPNRVYTVQENGVVAYWYNDALPAGALDVAAEASAYVVQPGEMVRILDKSSGNPVTWEWSMPGAVPITSSEQNPEVSYSTPGVYQVTLTITNDEGDSFTETFSQFIRVDVMEVHWWNESVFYEVFVRSFKDSNGDGKGDLQGLIEKLDYLNDGNPDTTTDLGITGIWLMPVQQSPSYHGYDATDYNTIEADYGTNEDFITLIQEAHARGIKVIVDMVMNHTSNEHPWFVASNNPDSPMRDWYIWEESDPGTAGPFENYPWHPANGDYYYGAFWGGMPDLNFYNEEVHDEFEDIAAFWLEEMGVDGFRLDAVKFLHENGSAVQNTPETIAYWQEFRAFYKSVNPDAFAVGEAWDLTSIAQQYVNNNGLDYCFEFELADSIINGLNGGNAADLNNQMEEVMKAYPFLQFGTILSNHDSNRVMSQFTGDMPKARAAAALLLTLPGIPYIYYGEEIGMTGMKPDPNLRTPMQWTGTVVAGFTTGTPWHSINADFTSKNVAAQQGNSGSLWHYYRNLIALRNTEDALTKGNFKKVTATSPSVFAFIRQFEDENILVVVNTGAAAVDETVLTMAYGGIAQNDYALVEMFGNGNNDVTITPDGGFETTLANIPAKGVRIYKFKDPLSVQSHEHISTVLYPNPAKSHFSLNIVAGNVELYTITGQLVKSYTGEADNQYDVSGVESGIYIVKVTDSEKRQSTLKLIIE